MEATITRNTLKSIVSGLRREIRAAEDPKKLSHTQMLELFARALGKPTYAALLAELPEDKKADEVVPAVEVTRLVNEGQFDFVKQGRDGELLSGFLNMPMQGTKETIFNCVAAASGATRHKSGSLEPGYAGDTDVCWDDQKTDKGPNGLPIWVSEGGDDWQQEWCVLVPEGFNFDDAMSDPAYDEAKPRQALIAAFVSHMRQRALVETVKAELAASVMELGPVLNQVEDDLGFALIASERVVLLEELSK